LPALTQPTFAVRPGFPNVSYDPLTAFVLAFFVLWCLLFLCFFVVVAVDDADEVMVPPLDDFVVCAVAAKADPARTNATAMAAMLFFISCSLRV
jgi:hypothetical protein